MIMRDIYTFKREFELNGYQKTIEHKVTSENLSELLEEFIYFLNGCSYSYIKDLIFVKEDGTEISVFDFVQENYEEECEEESPQKLLNL